MNYVFADLETSHSNVNTLCVLEANFTLYDDRFRKLEELDRKCRIKSTVVPSIGALMTNGIKVDMLKGANQSSFNLICEIILHRRNTIGITGTSITFRARGNNKNKCN